MSLSNPRSQSPVSKYFRVSAGNGTINYWDKAASKEVVMDLPFRFIVLDVLTTIGGFHEATNSGIFSNEVRSNDEILTVRNKNGVLAQGSYNDIKDRIKADGAKFANAVYIAYREDGELALGKITFVGASVSAWFDFKKGRFLDQQPGVAISGFTAEKKGRTEYFVPTFEGLSVATDDLATAQALDETLQAYLKGSQSHEPEAVRNDEPEQIAFSSPGSQADFDSAPPF